MSYGQSSSSKAGPIKPVLVKLANQVQQKDAPIKESEGLIVIDNLDPSDDETISKGAVINNHEAQNSTCCPSGLSRTQKRKLQRARCMKLKQEGPAKEQESVADIEKVS